MKKYNISSSANGKQARIAKQDQCLRAFADSDAVFEALYCTLPW